MLTFPCAEALSTTAREERARTFLKDSLSGSTHFSYDEQVRLLLLGALFCNATLGTFFFFTNNWRTIRNSLARKGKLKITRKVVQVDNLGLNNCLAHNDPESLFPILQVTGLKRTIGTRGKCELVISGECVPEIAACHTLPSLL